MLPTEPHGFRTVVVAGLGDSVTFGVGDAGPDCVGPSWAGRFAHDIGAHAFINVSGTGRRAADLIRTQVPLVLEYKPSYALISVGGNDVLRRKFDPVMVGRQLREAATALIAIDCQVVVLGLPDPRRYLPLPRVLVEILADRADLVNCALQACMQDFIRDRHITWIDTWGDSNSSASQHWHIDRMHPSAAGHQYLADVARRHVGLRRRTIAMPTYVEDLSPSLGSRIWWLLRKGIPWFAKRSVDLIPELVIACLTHSHTRQRHVLAISGLAVTAGSADHERIHAA